ncbi:hypothetical protein Tco_1478851 [Tanacetum coccineum]
MLQVIRECCTFPVVGMYYSASKKDLSKHLKPIRNDEELANFIKTAFENGGKVDLFVKHLEHVGEEDVVISHVGRNSTTLKADELEYNRVDERFKVKEGELWYRRNDYRSIAVLYGRNVKEGRCSSQKGKQNEDNKGSSVTYKWIAKQFAAECKRAKQMAVYDHEGGLIDHYEKLWDYRDQLLTKNPGSSVDLEVETLDGGKTVFRMMYICFKAMKNGWNGACRRVIRLDGYFLSSTWRGELLTAMGRDANNQMFHMDWVAAGIENCKN